TPEDLYSIKDNTLTITATETNFTCDHIGVNPVTLTITDAGNNISTCTAIVTVEDNLAPILADLPTDQLNIPMDAGACGAVITFGDPTATDNCDAAVSVVRTDTTGLDSGDLFPAGTTT